MKRIKSEDEENKIVSKGVKERERGREGMGREKKRGKERECEKERMGW